MSTPTPTTSPPPPPLIPPLSFSMVSPGVYRSGHPLPINYPLLTLLTLRTIIYLSDEPPPSPSYLTFCDTHDIAMHHIHIPPVKEPFIENSPTGMYEALLLLLDKRNHPVLIHSNKGKHRAGVLVGCMRKILQGWSLAATFAEYGRYAGEKGEADLEFIELFNPELRFDKRHAPAWLRVKYVPVPVPAIDSNSNSSADSKAEEERLELRKTLVTTHLPRCRLAAPSSDSTADSAANLVRGVGEAWNASGAHATTAGQNRREVIST
ncbi:tyrosine phosphatase family-domain-containing protein [Peziza echinospora]|nr:tyrosine phosphatase family-domain-containing protein [Peziza echinospora]